MSRFDKQIVFAEAVVKDIIDKRRIVSSEIWQALDKTRVIYWLKVHSSSSLLELAGAKLTYLEVRLFPNFIIEVSINPDMFLNHCMHLMIS